MFMPRLTSKWNFIQTQRVNRMRVGIGVDSLAYTFTESSSITPLFWNDREKVAKRDAKFLGYVFKYLQGAQKILYCNVQTYMFHCN